MSTDITTGHAVSANGTSPTASTEKKDPEVEALEKQTARVEARQKLIAAQLAAAGDLSPGLSDAPKNTVTFGAKSGSLAPWLAQSVLADVAAGIAEEAWASLHPAKPDGTRGECDGNDVVFVTDDPELLASDVVSRQVQALITGRTNELADTVGNLAAAGVDLQNAVTKYTAAETRRTNALRSAAEWDSTAKVQLLLATDAATLAAANTVAAQEAADTAAAGAAPTAEAEGDTAEAGQTPAATATSPFAVAIDLVRLLAVDYTVTAAEVTADSALLARLTAGQLGKTRGTAGDQVLLDGFALSSNTETIKEYTALIAALNKTTDAAQDLSRAVAPISAEADEYQLAVNAVQDAWEKASADKDASPDGAAHLKTALDELRLRLTARQGAAAPATGLIEDCETLTATIRDELATLATPDSTGVSPLQRASSRDRLRAPDSDHAKDVSHILLVQATHTGADIVTRHSILGSSGRVGYLGGANGAWVMADTEGFIAGGGAVDKASNMTHDIGTGESKKNPIDPGTGTWTSSDPLEKNEQWIRVGVLLLALAITLVGIAGTFAIFLQN